MQKAYLNVIKFGLAKGMKFTVTEWDPDEENADLYMSSEYKKIKEEIEAVDECQLFVFNSDGEYQGNFFVIPDYSMEPEETVVDFTITDFTKEWEDQYEGYKL